MHSAEIEVLKYVQRQSFSEELVCLLDKESEVELKKSVRASCARSVKNSSSIAKLDPVLRDGLLCVGGRLRRALIEQEQRHPVILPKRHHVADLIVRHYHLLSGHSGQEFVLSLIRKSYWIIKGRVAVRRVLSRCFSCRRRQAPFGAQKMADLLLRESHLLNPRSLSWASIVLVLFGLREPEVKSSDMGSCIHVWLPEPYIWKSPRVWIVIRLLTLCAASLQGEVSPKL